MRMKVLSPSRKPGWVSVEKGYQWRQEDGSFLQPVWMGYDPG